MKLIKNKKGHHELIILGIFSGIAGFVSLKLKKLKRWKIKKNKEVK